MQRTSTKVEKTSPWIHKQSLKAQFKLIAGNAPRNQENPWRFDKTQHLGLGHQPIEMKLGAIFVERRRVGKNSPRPAQNDSCVWNHTFQGSVDKISIFDACSQPESSISSLFYGLHGVREPSFGIRVWMLSLWGQRGLNGLSVYLKS